MYTQVYKYVLPQALISKLIACRLFVSTDAILFAYLSFFCVQKYQHHLFFFCWMFLSRDSSVEKNICFQSYFYQVSVREIVNGSTLIWLIKILNSSKFFVKERMFWRSIHSFAVLPEVSVFSKTSICSFVCVLSIMLYWFSSASHLISALNKKNRNFRKLSENKSQTKFLKKPTNIGYSLECS